MYHATDKLIEPFTLLIMLYVKANDTPSLANFSLSNFDLTAFARRFDSRLRVAPELPNTSSPRRVVVSAPVTDVVMGMAAGIPGTKANAG